MSSIPGSYIANDSSSRWIWENSNGQPTNVIRTFRTTFDLTGLAIGAYDVVVQDGVRSSTAAGAFTVVSGNPGRLSINVIVPDRFGSFGAQATPLEHAAATSST